MKAELLSVLRDADDYVSGQDLCEKFGVSRTAVWKGINQLKEAGYEIEAVPNKGYKLLSVPPFRLESLFRYISYFNTSILKIQYFRNI